MSLHSNVAWPSPCRQHSRNGAVTAGQPYQPRLSDRDKQDEPEKTQPFVQSAQASHRSSSRGKSHCRAEIFDRLGPRHRVALPQPITSAASLGASAANEPIHSISGYVYGALTYPGFVIQGASQGNVLLLSSPSHGMVANTLNVGNARRHPAMTLTARQPPVAAGRQANRIMGTGQAARHPSPASRTSPSRPSARCLSAACTARKPPVAMNAFFSI